MKRPWNYLIVTASNAIQARAYESQLRLRRELDLLPQVRECFVVSDLEDKRIGSGGSTICCLLEVLAREWGKGAAGGIEAVLRELRILIVHAGGDSKRLPAYGPCGKIFVPVPSHEEGGAIPQTLFDRLVPAFLDLPESVPGEGQIVVAAGDALLQFDASRARFDRPGVTALACEATPEEASRHGVFCAAEDGEVSLYLQKPSVAEQQAAGAVNSSGLTALDAGVMNFDAKAAAALLEAFGVEGLALSPQARERLLEDGVDLYREVCCAMGTAATLEHYVRDARSSGSKWPDESLARMFPLLRAIPFFVEIVPDCRFLHFGSTRQLVESGRALLGEPDGVTLVVNSRLTEGGRVEGPGSWVEGCRISAPLRLDGQNVVVGIDVDEALKLPPGACLDVLAGEDRGGNPVHFVRCYSAGDTFKDARYCGRPLDEWLRAAALDPAQVWHELLDASDRTLWNACLFPAVREAADYRKWLWMLAPERATAAEKLGLLSADRYSSEEIALLTAQGAFHSRRLEIWAEGVRESGPRVQRVLAMGRSCFG